MTPDADESIRCSVCSCVCFKPGRSVEMRSCDRCGHGWVAHAMEKLQLGALPLSGCGPAEVALPGPVFDLSSLVLYGAQAVPVRLKILLDRLYSVLTSQQVSHILNILSWSLTDYNRGYMLQSADGKVLDRWVTITPDEEVLVLQQFLRFGETRPIVELMTPRRPVTPCALSPVPKSSHNKQNVLAKQVPAAPAEDFLGQLDKNNKSVDQFEKSSGRLPLLLPFQIQHSTLHYMAPPTKDVVPLTKLMRWLQRPCETRRSIAPWIEDRTGPRANEGECQTAVKIKPDPDMPNLGWSLWQQRHRIFGKQEINTHGGVSREDTSSSLCPLSSPFLCPLASPKLQSSSSPSFFSSSCSLSSLPHQCSSSLHPLPPLLCSHTSPPGGRKGRVCCGVCGKSFYDKGTLKIHYNAVHLKIKHRCTVAGCTMVFSSLRSRNRHSANPNPRLHTSTNRHTQTDTHSKPGLNTGDEHMRAQSGQCLTPTGLTNGVQREQEHKHKQPRDYNTHTPYQPIHDVQNDDTSQTHIECCDGQHAASHMMSPPPPPLPSPHHHSISNESAAILSLSHSFAVPHGSSPCPHKHTHALIHPESEGNPNAPSPPTATSNNHSLKNTECSVRGWICLSPPSSEQVLYESSDLTPKKKPRKSSVPVKIERQRKEVIE